MSPKPLVSIVINNYNYGRFLGAAIQSALDQTYNPVETIVVDDGSTDNSREVIDSFGNRVQSILKQNGGQGSAFNSGFGASRGDLILFLDSDDRLRPEAVQKSVKTWREGLSKLHFPLRTIDDQGRRLGRTFPKTSLAAGNVLSTLLSEGDYCVPPTSGNVFSREFLNAVMPVPEDEWRDSADTYIVQTAPFYGEIGRIEEGLGEYRMHGPSLTSGVMDGHVRIKTLHLHLNLGRRRQRLLEHFAGIHGYKMAPNAATNTQNYFKIRLISLKMSPSDHPFKEDRLLPTLGKLLALTIQNRKAKFFGTLAYCVWAPLFVALPRVLSEKLAIAALATGSRSRVRMALSGA